VRFRDSLGAALRLAIDAEAHKHRIGEADKNIVNPIHMNIFHSPLLHILQGTLALETGIHSPISVGGEGDLK